MEYVDATFTQRKGPSGTEVHLGILGAVKPSLYFGGEDISPGSTHFDAIILLLLLTSFCLFSSTSLPFQNLQVQLSRQRWVIPCW